MKKASVKVAAGLLATVLGLTSGTVQAQQADKINVVTSAVPFLRISPDARAGGMGDVGIATPADANSSFWNLSKLHWNKNQSGVGVTYTPWLKDLGLNDVYMATISGYYKLDDEQVIAGGLRYFNLGNIQFTDYAGNDLQQFRPREFSFDVGYTRKLDKKLALGVALRYINSSLANGAVGGTTYKAGSTFAGDLSLMHNGQKENGEGWNWGIVLSNLGGKIGYTNDAQNKDYIPANLGLGAAYTTVFDETSKLTIGLDVNKLLVPTPPSLSGVNSVDSAKLADYRNQSVFSSWFKSFGDAGGFGNELKEFQVSLGAEYAYNDQFFVRAGYFYEDKLKGNRKYFTAGVGLTYNVIGINFSYLVPSGSGVNRNPLSNTMRFGLTFNFDGADKK